MMDANGVAATLTQMHSIEYFNIELLWTQNVKFDSKRFMRNNRTSNSDPDPSPAKR